MKFDDCLFLLIFCITMVIITFRCTSCVESTEKEFYRAQYMIEAAKHNCTVRK